MVARIRLDRRFQPRGSPLDRPHPDRVAHKPLTHRIAKRLNVYKRARTLTVPFVLVTFCCRRVRPRVTGTVAGVVRSSCERRLKGHGEKTLPDRDQQRRIERRAQVGISLLWLVVL